jgi:hypothetical protein
MPLAVDSNGGPLRIVLVPVRYDADGSGRLPNLDEALLDRFHDFAYALFPVREVELVVRDAPMPFGGAVSRDGSGWSALLNACRTQRVADDPPDDTYYYCVFVPARTFGDYCGRSCTAGLGFVPDAREVSARTSIGLGYPGSEDTFAHEVGHTLGRPHAPCGGVASSDPGFPHAGGRIGVWGYDLVGNQLRDPASFGDLMGYCDPKWISDYNYARIFSRIRTVRASAFTIAEDVRAHHTVVVDVDESLTWGGSVSLRGTPPGEAIGAEWITPTGVRTSTTAYYSRASDLPGGVLSVEAGAPAGSRLVIEGLGSIAL